MCWLCAVPLCITVFPHSPGAVALSSRRRTRGGGTKPCGSVYECHTVLKQWNNGSNVGEPPLPAFPLSHTLVYPQFSRDDALPSHTVHSIWMHTHKRLYQKRSYGEETENLLLVSVAPCYVKKKKKKKKPSLLTRCRWLNPTKFQIAASRLPDGSLIL